MKTVFNIVLFLCAAGLAYVCYDSIRGPAGFRQKKEAREKAVAARLADIRKAQQAYCGQHNGRYAASFDTLIAFVKAARPASLQGFDADSLRFIPFGGNRQFGGKGSLRRLSARARPTGDCPPESQPDRRRKVLRT